MSVCESILFITAQSLTTRKGVDRASNVTIPGSVTEYRL
jgi:hypothetical protein